MTGEEIFNQITGLGFTGTGELFLSQIKNYNKEKKNDATLPPEDVHYNHKAACMTKEYNFDFHFNKSSAARANTAEYSSSDEYEDEN